MPRPVPSVMKYFCSFYNPSAATYLPPVNVKKNMETHPCPSLTMANAANSVKNSDQGSPVLFTDPTRGQWRATPLHVVKPSNDSQHKCSKLETCRSTPSDAFLQLAMADRIVEVVSKKKLQGVTVIEQYAAARDCLVTPQLIDLKTAKQTKEWIKAKSREEQRVLANKLASWVKAVGFADARFETIRINDEGEFFVLQTRPYGLFVEEDTGFSKGHSVEKCARVGLSVLHQSALSESGLEEFAKEVQRHYRKSLSDFSWTRIILSILCPLIPLAFLIISVYKTCVIKSLADGDKETVNRYYQEIENVLF